MSSKPPHDLNALTTLASICGEAASTKKINNGDGNDAHGSGEAPTAPALRASLSNNIPAAVGPSLNDLLAIYQQQGQQQYMQQQAVLLQQAAAERVGHVLSSMPPQLVQAYLSSQPGVTQALLQSALGVAGGRFTVAAQPAAPGLAASAEQQNAQLQLMAARILAAPQQATSGASAEKRKVLQPPPAPTGNVAMEVSVGSSLSSGKRAVPSPPRKRSPAPAPPLNKLPPKKKRCPLSNTTTNNNNTIAVASAAETSSSHPSSETKSAECDEKKLAKAAANRLSVQLSRKRKKMFVEDLKTENTELRRMDMILRSIPGHIVAFDSSGCITFASQSFNRVMDLSDEEESTSFWDVLNEDSVRLIKSAFMDALAVKKKSDDDKTPLADGGSISVRIVEERGGLPFSLKGVVHFASDSPECVCTLSQENQTNDVSFLNDTNAKHISDISSHAT